MIKKFFLVFAFIFSSASLFSSIYITGYNADFYPCLWITDNEGTKLTTTILDKQNGTGSAVLFSNNQLFIAGKADDKPCLWITDLFGNTKKKILLAEDNGYASQLTFYKNSLYLVGAINNKTTLWIIDLSTFSMFTKSVGKGFNATNLAIHHSNVYITGQTATEKPISTHPPASLWITDLDGNTKDTIYLSDIGSCPTGISEKNNAIYLVSFENNLNLPSSTFFLTKLDLEGNVLDKVIFASQQIYSECYNIISTDPQSYILANNGLFSTFLSQITSIPYMQPLTAPSSAIWNDFILQNNRYVIVGADAPGATLYFYDMQGNLLKKTVLDQPRSSAVDLATTPSSLSLLKFSPIKYQKGSN